MLRRLAALGAGLTLVAVAYGCGSSDPSVSVGTHRAVTPADGATTKSVQYRGIAFDVPADWDVVDLEQDPTACVRFDRHAVYLGTPSPDMQCPASILGHTDGLVVQPGDLGVAQEAGDTAAAATEQVNGLDVAVADNSATSGQLDVATNGVALNFVLGGDETAARSIIATIRPVAS